MHYNNQSQEFKADQSYHVERIVASPFNNINSNKNIKTNQPFLTGKYINVLSPHKNTGKLQISPQFQQFMSFQNSNPSSVVVSMLGPRKIGKSFVLDNLLSFQSGQIRRIMSKNKQELINSPSIVSTNLQGDRIIYLDNNGPPSPSIFLWLYFLSSVMVYNMNPSNENQQSALIECLVYCHNNIQSPLHELSKPQLIILRRDVGNKQIFDFDLVRKIEQFQLFLPQIIVIHLPYPGKKNVMDKQILDVPLKQLDPNFINQVKNLHQYIRMAKPKRIQGTYLTPQTLSIVLQPLTKAINNEQQLSSKKIWNQVYQSLSIAYYNNYLKIYCEQLERQFETEQPCDKYTLYKKLSKIRRKSNKKMERYNIINNQPTFLRYMEKLNETIKSKQQLLKEVNTAKSRQFHNKNFNQIFSKLNENNYQELIDKYCQSKLDDQKTQVLLQNLDKVIANKAKPIPKLNLQSPAPNPQPQLKPYQPSEELINLKKNIEQIDMIILNKSKIPAPAPPPQNMQNLQVFKSAIQNKKVQLSSIKEEIEKLAKAPPPVNNDENSQLMEQLQQQKSRLREEIQNEQKKINSIRLNKIKETKMKLQQEYRRQQQAMQKLLNTAPQQTQRIAKAGSSTKKTCCLIM